MKKRVWQRMLSGRRLDLLDPSSLDIEIEDIAHGLSFLARWNGQTQGTYSYSVAEHSLLVEYIFSMLNPNINPKWKLAALLHDSAEYVIGDLISPVKNTIGKNYELLEDRLMIAVYRRFGLTEPLTKSIIRKIKLSDKHSAWLEAVKIAGFTEIEANKIFGIPKIKNFINFEIVPKPPLEAKTLFLKKHFELIRLI